MVWNLQKSLAYLPEMFHAQAETFLRYWASYTVSYHLQKAIKNLYVLNLSECTSHLMYELRFSGNMDTGQGIEKDKKCSNLVVTL